MFLSLKKVYVQSLGPFTTIVESVLTAETAGLQAASVCTCSDGHTGHMKQYFYKGFMRLQKQDQTTF